MCVKQNRKMNMPDNPTESFRRRNPRIYPTAIFSKPDAVPLKLDTANAAPGKLKIQLPTPKKKRAKNFAANNESRKMLESEGWSVAVVEQRIPHCFITRDAFGFADLICCAPHRGILAVQVTSGGNGPARIAKIRQEARAGIWLTAPGRIQVHDWRKRAGQKTRECVIVEITTAM